MASFLESLFGSFTGQPAVDAANAARSTLHNTFSDLVSQNRGQAATSLEGTPLGYQQSRAAYSPFYQQSRTDLGEFGGAAAGLANEIYGQPLGQTAGMTANALGLGGPGGTAAAQAAFQTGPGYQFELGQGLEAINRSANAAGMGASGNMLREAQTFGQGLANREYKNWVDNLQQRESLYGPLAGREADYLNTLGQNLGNLNQQAASFYGASFPAEQAALSGLRLSHLAPEVNLAGIFGPALASTDLAVGAAQQQAGANTINTALGIGNTLSNIFSPGR